MILSLRMTVDLRDNTCKIFSSVGLTLIFLLTNTQCLQQCYNICIVYIYVSLDDNLYFRLILV